MLFRSKIRDQLTLMGEKLRDSDKKGEFPEKLLKEKQDLINRLKNLGEKINPEIFNAE